MSVGAALCGCPGDHIGSPLQQPITLEPLSKFPLVRDLKVDRQEMFENLKKIKPWVPLDGTHDLGPGDRLSPLVQNKAYQLSCCISCGCCLEACPQVNIHNDFMGAPLMVQAQLSNMRPVGDMYANERLDVLMGPGGLSECSHAQNCVEVCPKDIPLTESIATMQKAATGRLFKKILGIS